MMIELAIFIVITLPLIIFTLNRPHPHRFPRFFVFESVLGIVMLNVNNWFVDPFSYHQVISWIFLAGSLGLAVHGFWLLHAAGLPDGDFENTTQLITIGAYSYIRHPLYCSLLLGGFGAFLKAFSIAGFVLLIILAGSVFVTGKIEEAENLKKFGEEYRKYMKRTKMFIPYLI